MTENARIIGWPFPFGDSPLPVTGGDENTGETALVHFRLFHRLLIPIQVSLTMMGEIRVGGVESRLPLVLEFDGIRIGAAEHGPGTIRGEIRRVQLATLGRLPPVGAPVSLQLNAGEE